MGKKKKSKFIPIDAAETASAKKKERKNNSFFVFLYIRILLKNIIPTQRAFHFWNSNQPLRLSILECKTLRDRENDGVICKIYVNQ